MPAPVMNAPSVGIVCCRNLAAVEQHVALGVKPVFVDTRWPSIIPALKLGRYDIIFGGMSVTAAREQKVDFAKPFMTVGQTILLNKKHQGIITSYQDLNDPKFTDFRAIAGSWNPIDVYFVNAVLRK